MTPIRPVTILCARTTLTRTLTAAALGAVIGLSATVAAMQYIGPIVAPNQRAMIAACRMPDVPGAMSVWTMGLDGKLQCWRFK